MQRVIEYWTILSKKFKKKKIPGKLGQVLGIAGKPLMSSIIM